MSTRLEMLIDDIVIEERTRKDVGDLTSLMASITDLGLLQPIGVTADGRLAFGERRLQASKRLGHASIPVTVVASADDHLNALRAELEENIERKPFTPIEAARLRRRIKDLAVTARSEFREHQKLEERAQTVSADDSTETESSTAPPLEPATVSMSAAVAPPTAAEIDAKVAQATGYSVTTLKRVDRIADMVNCGDPATEAAARDALVRIDAGAAVKPLLDEVVELHTAALIASHETEEPVGRSVVAEPLTEAEPFDAVPDIEESPADPHADELDQAEAIPDEPVDVPVHVAAEPYVTQDNYPPANKPAAEEGEPALSQANDSASGVAILRHVSLRTSEALKHDGQVEAHELLVIAEELEVAARGLRSLAKFGG